MKPAIKRLLLAFILSGVSAYMVFLNIGNWLSIVDPPQKSDIIISLSGTPDRISKSAQLFHAKFADKVMVMNNDDFKLMLKQKIPPDKILIAEWPAESTYQEGLLINQLLSDRDYTSALVVSDPFHLYRAKWSLQHTLEPASLRLSFIPTDSSSSKCFWWANSQSRLFVLNELPKIIYYWVWHGMLDLEDDPEWAIRIEKTYQVMLSLLFV